MYNFSVKEFYVLELQKITKFCQTKMELENLAELNMSTKTDTSDSAVFV